MKRVKCGAFWIDVKPTQARHDELRYKYEWRGAMYRSVKSETPIATISSGILFKTPEDAQRDIDKFIAAANRDNSLPLAGTVK